MFKCQECGKKFKTSDAAERAVSDGCPGCGGSDIDLDTGATAGGGISPVRKSKPDRLPRAENIARFGPACARCGGREIISDGSGGYFACPVCRPGDGRVHGKRATDLYSEATNPSNGWECPEPDADSLHPEGL